MAVKNVDRIRLRAYELARTGQHIDCLTIESALLREGYPDVYSALQDPFVRRHIRELCAAHWSGLPTDRRYDGEAGEIRRRVGERPAP